MISHLDGIVCAIAPEGAVIEVGGVGLLVQATPGTLAGLRTGERARVATSLVVREDALTLYGFASDDERDVFELVQTCSGVGPRLALAMLASFSPDGLRHAIASEDVAALTRVPGIGRKGAQRIVLELAGRLGSPAAPAGVLGAWLLDPHIRLYCLAAGFFLVAAGLVLGSNDANGQSSGN